MREQPPHFSLWLWSMLAQDLLTLEEANEQLALELLYRRAGV